MADYRDFLEDFGKCFNGANLKKLKFLLADYLDDKTYNDNRTAVKLFDEVGEHMEGNNIIVSSTKLKIFSNIRDLTQLVEVKEKLATFSEKNPSSLENGIGLKPYRCILYRGIKQAVRQDFDNAISFYKLSHISDIKDLWDLALHLQVDNQLKTRKDLNRFAKRLSETAKSLIEDALKELVIKKDGVVVIEDGKPFIGDGDKLVELVPVQQVISFQQVEKKKEETQRAVADIAVTSKHMEKYDMKHNPHGICLIINNVDFTNMKRRTGSDKDEESLKRVFDKFGFKIESKRNQTAQEMKDLMDEMRRRDHTEYDCFVCCILSHGQYDKVFGIDEETCDIYDLTAKAGSCEDLRSKPKVFFIQACRNAETPEHDGEATKKVDDADFLMGYSTAPLTVSWRNPTKGSYFIECLTEALTQYHETHHILDILTYVNGQVSQKVNPQVPFPAFSLTKRLYFKPL